MLILIMFLLPVCLTAQDVDPSPYGGEYEAFQNRLAREEQLLEKGVPVESGDLERLKALYNRLQELPYEDLLLQAEMLLFLVKSKFAHLSEEVPQEPEGNVASAPAPVNGRRDSPERYNMKLVVGLTSSAVSAGLFNLFWMFGDYSYNNYLATEYSEEAARYKQLTRLYDTLSLAALSAAVLSFGLTIPLLLSGPDAVPVPAVNAAAGDDLDPEDYTADLIRKRDRVQKKLEKTGDRTYAAVPRTFLAISMVTGIGNTLLFSVGSELYYDRDPRDNYSQGTDPLTITGIAVGSLANAALLSALATSFTHPAHLNLETEAAAIDLQLRTIEQQYGIDTRWKERGEETLGRLESRREVLLARLIRAREKKRAYTTGTLLSFGIGALSLAATAVEMKMYRNSRYNDEGGGLRFVPGPGLIVGTASAGGLGITTGTIISLFRPRVRRIQREIDYIDNRIAILKSTISTSGFRDRSSQAAAGSSDTPGTAP